MPDSTEDRSLQLMAEMRRLQAEASASFAKTDTALARFGLTRDSIAPVVRSLRAKLPKAVQLKLEKLDQARRLELELELASNRQLISGKHSDNKPSRSMRLALMHHI